ncbi:hypothetical protein T439DRAFT_152441 [Meredithblackwellia eburnea MCA 4105]
MHTTATAADVAASKETQSLLERLAPEIALQIISLLPTRDRKALFRASKILRLKCCEQPIFHLFDVDSLVKLLSEPLDTMVGPAIRLVIHSNRVVSVLKSLATTPSHLAHLKHLEILPEWLYSEDVLEEEKVLDLRLLAPVLEGLRSFSLQLPQGELGGRWAIQLLTTKPYHHLERLLLDQCTLPMLKKILGHRAGSLTALKLLELTRFERISAKNNPNDDVPTMCMLSNIWSTPSKLDSKDSPDSQGKIAKHTLSLKILIASEPSLHVPRPIHSINFQISSLVCICLTQTLTKKDVQVLFGSSDHFPNLLYLRLFAETLLTQADGDMFNCPKKVKYLCLQEVGGGATNKILEKTSSSNSITHLSLITIGLYYEHVPGDEPAKIIQIFKNKELIHLHLANVLLEEQAPDSSCSTGNLETVSIDNTKGPGSQFNFHEISSNTVVKLLEGNQTSIKDILVCGVSIEHEAFANLHKAQTAALLLPPYEDPSGVSEHLPLVQNNPELSTLVVHLNLLSHLISNNHLAVLLERHTIHIVATTTRLSADVKESLQCLSRRVDQSFNQAHLLPAKLNHIAWWFSRSTTSEVWTRRQETIVKLEEIFDPVRVRLTYYEDFKSNFYEERYSLARPCAKLINNAHE